MSRNRKRRSPPNQDEALMAWEELQKSKGAHQKAETLANRLRKERQKNHLEELLRKALVGRRAT